MFGGISRLKHHLKRIPRKDVILCDEFLAKFTTQMQFVLDNIKEGNEKRVRMKLEIARMGISPITPLGSHSSSVATSPRITYPFCLYHTTL
jgi:hypothetical protein